MFQFVVKTVVSILFVNYFSFRLFSKERDMFIKNTYDLYKLYPLVYFVQQIFKLFGSRSYGDSTFVFHLSAGTQGVNQKLPYA